MCSTPSERLILTEFAQHGSLSDVFIDKEDALSFQHKMIMIKQISSAMEALPAVDMVHMDLAARNVLVFEFDPANPQRTRVKVSDFGLSISTYGRSHRTVAGNLLPFRWMSPEALEKRRFSEASDMWAMGVTMWEIMTGGKMPYAFTRSDDDVAEGVCAGTLRLSRPEGCPDSLWDIISKCWEKDPKKRPSFVSLSSALDGLDFEMLCAPLMTLKVCSVPHIGCALFRSLIPPTFIF